MSKTDRFYRNKLQLYFDEHYAEYEDTVEYYNNPAPNQWKFYIPELSVVVTLICDDLGGVTAKAKIKRI